MTASTIHRPCQRQTRASALSAADVGIAISEGAEIAREIADITIKKDSLDEVVLLRHLSMDLMKRVHGNYRFVISFNLGLILLGVAGIITPSMSLSTKWRRASAE